MTSKWSAFDPKYMGVQSQLVQVQMLEDRPSSLTPSVMFLTNSWSGPLWVGMGMDMESDFNQG